MNDLLFFFGFMFFKLRYNYFCRFQLNLSFSFMWAFLFYRCVVTLFNCAFLVLIFVILWHRRTVLKSCLMCCIKPSWHFIYYVNFHAMGGQKLGAYIRKKLLHACPYFFSWTPAAGHCGREDAAIWARVYILTDQFKKRYVWLLVCVTEHWCEKKEKVRTKKNSQCSGLPAAGHSGVEQQSLSSRALAILQQGKTGSICHDARGEMVCFPFFFLGQLQNLSKIVFLAIH